MTKTLDNRVLLLKENVGLLLKKNMGLLLKENIDFLLKENMSLLLKENMGLLLKENFLLKERILSFKNDLEGMLKQKLADILLLKVYPSTLSVSFECRSQQINRSYFSQTQHLILNVDYYRRASVARTGLGP